MSLSHPAAPRTESGRIATCSGKKALSAFRAFHIAARMNRKKEIKPKVRAYRCPLCGQHHIGSQSY